MQQSKTEYPLRRLLNRWWMTQQVKQLSLSAIDASFVEEAITNFLEEVRDAETEEDVYEMASLFPNKCLVEISVKCAAATEEDKRKCTVSICELLAMLLLFHGDNEEKQASAMMLASADEIYCRRGMIDSILEHVGSRDAESLQAWVQHMINDKPKSEDEEELMLVGLTTDETFDPRSLRLNLTEEEWIAAHPEVVIAATEERFKPRIILGVRNKWKQVKKKGNWKTGAVRRLLFEAPDGNWLKDKYSIGHPALCELLQSEEIGSSTLTRARNKKQ